MEHIANLTEYLEKEKVRDLLLGQSGARVCELRGNRVAKLVRRSELKEEGLWEKYVHEAQFYEAVKPMNLPFVPRVQAVLRQEDALLLVMEKYALPHRSELSRGLMEKAVEVLAKIHALPLPSFIEKPEGAPVLYTDESAAGCVQGWESVLREHGDAFSGDVLQEMARDMNRINRGFFSKRACFTHGDFHFENLLTDEDGNLRVCDWQGCGCGDPSGDLSFLISRLLSDGCYVDAEKTVEMYCRFANEMGLDVQPEEVLNQMALANLNVSFMYWHMYLHQADEARVRSIFGKMTEDYRRLKDGLLRL